MIIGILLIAALILMGWTYKIIKNAPVGYEDEFGFHVLENTPNFLHDKKAAA